MPKKAKTGGNTDIVHRMKGVSGSNYLVFDLKENQKIQSSPGSLIYMQGNIEKGGIKMGSMIKAFARAFGGEDFFISTYAGLQGGGTVAFSSDIPGDIIKIDLKKDEEYTISRSSFLCGTDNIEISSRIVAMGLFGIGTDEGFVMPTIKAKDGDASFWLANYGTFEKITLKSNETIILDNGVFLASPSSMNYEIVQLGKSFVASIFGGEGFGMKFTGPGEIYIQSKNLNDLFSLISKYVHVNVSSSNNKVELASNVFDMFNGDGGTKKKRAYKKKADTKTVVKAVVKTGAK